MSERNQSSAAAVSPAIGATPDAQTTSPLTITFYQQLANNFVKALDEITAVIPKLEISQRTTTSFVRSHLNVPTEFLGTAIAGVERTPELQGAGRLDVPAARATLQFIEAFRPVQDKVTAFANSLKFTMDSGKASLAADALQVYAIAKGVARHPEAIAVASLVANLKRDLGRRGRSKKPVAVAGKPSPGPLVTPGQKEKLAA